MTPNGECDFKIFHLINHPAPKARISLFRLRVNRERPPEKVAQTQTHNLHSDITERKDGNIVSHCLIY